MLTACAIFAVTLTFVIWQPRGLGIGWSAAAGAAVALLAGVIQLSDIPTVWAIVWNATGTFVALIVISLLLDKAGLFEWAALHVARWGGGSGRRLFVRCHRCSIFVPSAGCRVRPPTKMMSSAMLARVGL